jgi:hypothetical protein
MEVNNFQNITPLLKQKYNRLKSKLDCSGCKKKLKCSCKKSKK